MQGVDLLLIENVGNLICPAFSIWEKNCDWWFAARLTDLMLPKVPR